MLLAEARGAPHAWCIPRALTLQTPRTFPFSASLASGRTSFREPLRRAGGKWTWWVSSWDRPPHELTRLLSACCQHPCPVRTHYPDGTVKRPGPGFRALGPAPSSATSQLCGSGGSCLVPLGLSFLVYKIRRVPVARSYYVVVIMR